MLWLITLYTLLFTSLTYRRLNWAVYLTLATLPSYLIRSQILGIPFTLLEVNLVVIVITFFIQYRLTWIKTIRQAPFVYLMLLLLSVATLSVFMSPDLIRAAGIWKAYYLEPILFSLVLLCVIRSKADLNKLLWALSVSAVYLSLVAIWQYFSAWGVPAPYLNPDGSVDRVVSIFNYPNALGLYLGPIIILMTGWLAWSKSKFETSVKLIIIFLSFATIVLAKSEAAILSVMFIWLIWLLCLKKTRLLTVLGMVILVIVIFTQPGINNYLQEKILLQDYSGMIRRLIWQESWLMLKDNWLWGAGMAGYQYKIQPYHSPNFEIFLYPHNLVLNFWSELGLLGAIVMLSLMTRYLYLTGFKWFKTGSLFYLTLFLTLSQLVIHGLVDAPYLKNDLAVLFWTVICLYPIYLNIWRGARVVE